MGLDAAVDDIAAWSAIRTDPFTLADRLRNLRLAPWRDASGSGGRLRLAACGRRWHVSTGRGRSDQWAGRVPAT
ncbi:MAG: hypothetical protein R3C32_09515 [Chloroflexota bacterium]